MRVAGITALLAITMGCGIGDRTNLGNTDDATTAATDTWPSEGVFRVTGDVQAGDLTYRGGPAAEFDVTSVGYVESATDRPGGATTTGDPNDIYVGVDGSALVLWSRARSPGGVVDFDVFGPDAMDLNLRTDAGSIDVTDATGHIVLEATDILARRLSGTVDLYATGGDIDATVYPTPGGSVRVEAVSGNVRLALPFGLDYSLAVWGDAEQGITVENLGFSLSSEGEGTYTASSGPASVHVDVFAEAGTVTIVEAR